VNEKKDGASSL
jgi:hypothetical protein